jgi:hypothetical protein
MYQAEVSRTNPSAFVFLIDQSGSMDEPFGGEDGTIQKAQFVSDVLNRILNDLVLRATKGKNDVRDYYDIALIGYGGRVQSAWGGELAGQDLVPLSQVQAHPVRIERRVKRVPDSTGDLMEEQVIFPVWLDSVASGGTPMREAFAVARNLVADWVATHPLAYPPVMINITDGQPTDAPLDEVAEDAAAIRALATRDGHVVLANAHISGRTSHPLRYPRFDDPLTGLVENAVLLRDMSSPLIDAWVAPLSERTGLALSTEHSCSVYNAGPEDLVWLLDIGTRQDNLR